MSDLIKELDDLLETYNITIYDAMRIYEKNRKRRLIQRHEDSKNMWQYFSKELNHCGCGSNCYHYEYDKKDNKIYGVCNCCRTDIYEIKEEYQEEKLNQGVWL